VAALQELSARPDQPFFLAVGFHNPHVPWVAPQKYWDLYREAELSLPDNPYAPHDAPAFAAQSGADFYWYAGVPKDRKITPEFGRQCLHGYLAAISYIDAQVGRLLNALDESGLAENTTVIFWGDHGYYMGEHGWWGGKHNNYEGATRAPLIVSVPGQKGIGQATRARVDFVDIYPSLTEICSLPAPVGTEGRSFRASLEDPTSGGKTAAFSWYPKGGYMGVAMRTDRWRFVRWTKSGQPPVYELYDHQNDPAENQNLAEQTEYAQAIRGLEAQLLAAFPQTAVPYHSPSTTVKKGKGGKTPTPSQK
jgi:arylsulfatase A-like enzyme